MKRRKRQTTGRRGELLLGYTVGWARRRVGKKSNPPLAVYNTHAHVYMLSHMLSFRKTLQLGYTLITVESSCYFTLPPSLLFLQ